MTKRKRKESKTTDPVVRRLRELAREMPELEEACRVFGAILTLLRDTGIGASAVPLSAPQIRERMGQGLSLLPGLDLEVDTDSVRDLMIRLARAVDDAGIGGAAAVARAIEEGALDVSAILPHVASGAKEEVAAVAAKAGLDGGLVQTLAENAFKPALIAWRRFLEPLMEGVPWSSGACPVCGAVATLAEFQGLSQEKHLRCGMCGADWRFPRNRCAYCGDTDQAKQGILREEGRGEAAGAETCDACKGYLKAITSFEPAPVEMIAVNDLATVRLDFLAQRRGYRRGEIR